MFSFTSTPKKALTSVLLAILILFLIVPMTLALDTSSALYSATLIASNSGSNATDLSIPFSLSGQTLVDNNFIETDTLNTAVADVSGDLAASMPAGARLDVEGAVADDGGAQTDEIVVATSNDPSDMTLLPVAPEVDDAYYFGFNLQGRILVLSVGTAGTGVWTTTWEYYNGASWSALSGVEDRTEGFTKSGVRTVSFDRPSNWAETVIQGTISYWIRARVSAFTSITTQPLGTRAWWEGGQWWVYVDSLDTSEQKQYTLWLGGSDMVTHQQIFVGDGGLTTADNDTIEPSNQFSIKVKAFFDTSTNIGNTGYNDYLIPNSNGSIIELEELVGAATHWEAVDEWPADDDTSYVGTTFTSTFKTDLFEKTPVPFNAVIIDSITICWRWFGATADSKSRPALKIGETTYSDAAWNVNGTGSYLSSSREFNTSPATSSGWTVSEVEALEVGVSLLYGGSGNSVRCTQLYTGIDYSGRFIVIKDEALKVYVSDVEEITAYAVDAGGSSVEVSVANVTPGEYTIIVSSDGTVFVLEVQGVGTDSDTTITVDDNSNVWSWGLDGAVTYFDTIQLYYPYVAAFDSKASWDNGTVDGYTETKTGQPPINPSYHYSIESLADDGHWREGGSVFNDDPSHMYVGYSTVGVYGRTNVFVRFDNVQVTSNDTITEAYLNLNATLARGDTVCKVRISAIDNVDADAPTSYSEAEGANRTSSYVDWTLPAWELGIIYTSPNISSIINEIKNKSGWSQGNAIVIYIEDNGSTLGAIRLMAGLDYSSTEQPRVPRPVRLQLTLSTTPTLPDDYVRLKLLDMGGWTRSSYARIIYTGASRFGIRGCESATTNSAYIYQDIVASEGEVWSFGFWNRCVWNIGERYATIKVEWMSTEGGLISDTEVTNQGFSWIYTKIENQTAPSGTDYIRLRFMMKYSISDGYMAYKGAATPTYPNNGNELVNSNMEFLCGNSGNWTSPTINPTATDVDGSAISWVATSPISATITIQTSLDDQASWQTIESSGDSIPGVSEGFNFSGVNLYVRALFTSSNNIHTNEIGRLEVTITSAEDIGLSYQLKELISLTITDNSGLGNVGTYLEYPPMPTATISYQALPIETTGVMVSKKEEAQVPEVVPEVSPPSTMFGDDSGLTLPGGAFLAYWADMADIPVKFLWVVLATIGIIVVGASALIMTQSIAISAFAMGIGILGVVNVGSGLFPLWVFIFFGALALAVLLFRGRLPI